jgi:hypothetical protein
MAITTTTSGAGFMRKAFAMGRYGEMSACAQKFKYLKVMNEAMPHMLQLLPCNDPFNSCPDVTFIPGVAL